MIHRVATSGRYHSGLMEIQAQWSLDDVFDAIEILDMYDVLEDRMHANPNDEIIHG